VHEPSYATYCTSRSLVFCDKCCMPAGTANAVACADDAAVVARASREVRQQATDFVWAQLRELADVFERRCVDCCVLNDAARNMFHYIGTDEAVCWPCQTAIVGDKAAAELSSIHFKCSIVVEAGMFFLRWSSAHACAGQCIKQQRHCPLPDTAWSTQGAQQSRGSSRSKRRRDSRSSSANAHQGTHVNKTATDANTNLAEALVPWLASM